MKDTKIFKIFRNLFSLPWPRKILKFNFSKSTYLSGKGEKYYFSFSGLFFHAKKYPSLLCRYRAVSRPPAIPVARHTLHTRQIFAKAIAYINAGTEFI